MTLDSHLDALARRGRSALATVIAALALWLGGSAGAIAASAALRRLGLASLTTGTSGRIVFATGFLIGGAAAIIAFVVRYGRLAAGGYE